jgi:protoheme IX farnesyltransferase
MTTATAFLANPRPATAGEFFALLKPRVMSLVVFTALAGIVAAPGTADPFVAFTALLCIAVGAGASGALNMAYDSDIDGLMARTAGRPVPLGRISRGDALGFGWTLGIGSVAVMGLFVNMLSAVLLAFTILFYVAVYTLGLKRRTTQNIVIGGLAGALPPAIGWAAVTGSLTLAPLSLVFLIFMWTPAHFWALALFRMDDYARAGVPMMPVIEGKAITRRWIFAYALALLPVGVLPVFTGVAGPLYLAASLLFGIWVVVAAVRVWRETDAVREPAARRLFAVSIAYLFAVFSALIMERVLGLAPIGHATFGAWM